jgi:hypothetical protein
VTATPQPPQAAVRLYLRAGLRSVTWRRETLFFQRIGSATLVQWPNSHASIKQPHPSRLNSCLESRGRFRAVRRSTTLRNGLSPMIGRSASPSPKLKSMSSRRGSAPSSQPSVDHQPAATSSPLQSSSQSSQITERASSSCRQRASFECRLIVEEGDAHLTEQLATMGKQHLFDGIATRPAGGDSAAGAGAVWVYRG